VVLAVMHKAYQAMGLAGITGLCTNGRPIIVDVKSVLSPQEAHEQGVSYWRL
jgi:hypothetical protein